MARLEAPAYTDRMELTPALWALLALVIAIALSAWRPGLNAGMLSVTFAALIGLYISGLSIGAVAGFLPAQLILTLVAVAHFFEMARLNGSLDRLAGAALKLAHGHPARLPVIFFLITLVFSAIGPGNIAGTAMIAPIGMAVAARAGINPLLMAIMICTGANAGAFSPIALTGLINVGLMHDIGVDDPTAGWKIFVAVAVLQSVSALAAYVVFGGYRTRTASPVEAPGPIGVGGPSGVNIATDRAHLLTFVAMGVLITMVLVFKMNTAVAALLMATVLALVGAGSAEEALRTLPWSVIVMVSGISVLIGLVESTGGLDLATAAIASISTPGTINTVLALITGIVSMFSSSSGVVLPTFIPLIPGLIAQLGAGNVWKLIIAVDIGSHMVDVSPLSTLGALCLAALPPAIDKAPIFRGLLTWGFAMAIVAAALAFVFLDLIPW